MMTIKEGHIDAFKTLIWNGRANLNLQEDVILPTITYVPTCYQTCTFLQKVHHSAVFFAVQCNRLDMLDLLLRNERIDLSIRDIVSSDGVCSCTFDLICVIFL